ncbi:DNA-binding protein [Burkholderia cenocepacia]|nr:DNA-binding protein [Burkholderia cenocepacia]
MPTDRRDQASAGAEGRDLAIAIRAVQIYAERHPRPLQVTMTQAAEMLGISRWTVSKMVRFGQFKLNKCGMIPIGQVDRALAGD